MSKVKMFISAIAIVLLFCICVSAQTNCMFIGAEVGAENAHYDTFMVAQLMSWGYTVEEVVISEAVFYSDEDYADYDFIFLSESIISDDSAPLIEIPKPMLCSEGWAAKEIALCFGLGKPCDMIYGEPVKFLAAEAGHQLAAGYTPGIVVSLCDESDLIVWGQPTIPVIPIAGLESDTTKLMVYGIESGTDNAIGITIRNRVAMVGVHAWGYETLTEAAVKLYKAGIEWVLAGTNIEGVETVSPANFSLNQNYPNPFNPSTKIVFIVPYQAKVRIDVYDMMGRKVAELVDEEKSAGTYEVNFKAENLISGVYIYRLSYSDRILSRKMLLVK